MRKLKFSCLLKGLFYDLPYPDCLRQIQFFDFVIYIH